MEDAPSQWQGDQPHPFEVHGKLAVGVEFTVRQAIYEETPYLNELHRRYFKPRVGRRADDWRYELVPAPFRIPERLYIDIVYQRTLPGRRIRVRRILLGWHGFYLKAHCFSSCEPRMFRLDSVSAVIDYDGQVFETVDSWAETLPLRG